MNAMKTDALKLLRSIASESDLQSIVDSEADVLARFSSTFQPENIKELEESSFRDFLKYENNKHWTNLERQKTRLCQDMGLLRRTLEALMTEGVPINDRFDEALKFVGFGKGTLSALLLVAYPELYGVWNGISEEKMRECGIWPSFQRGSTMGEKYVVVNQVLLDVARQLDVSLWTLDALWWRVDLDRSSATGRAKVSNVPDPRMKSIQDIKASVLKTVKNANGQAVQTTVKQKDLLMTENELEARITELLDLGNNKCAITGMAFEFRGEGAKTHLRPSLDRIDSDGHYDATNVQLVCRFINFWKQATPDYEFRHLINIVRRSR